MSDGSTQSAKLRERLTTGTEDKLGKALADLLENPLVTGAIGKAFDARERAAQAQELALGVLNLPTAADMERLTRRLRSVSQRLEGIEDGVQRINRALSDGVVERRLEAVEAQLKALGAKIGSETPKRAAARPSPSAGTRAAGAKKSAGSPAKKSAGSGAHRAGAEKSP